MSAIEFSAGGYLWSGPEPEAEEGYALQDLAWQLVDEVGDEPFDVFAQHADRIAALPRWARRVARHPRGRRLMLRTLKDFTRDGTPVSAELADRSGPRERLGFYLAMQSVWVHLGFFDLGPAEKIEAQQRAKQAAMTQVPIPGS